MSTTADLPATAEPAANPAGAGRASSRRTTTERDDYLSWIVPHQDLDAFYTACFDKLETTDLGGGVTSTRPVPLKHPFAASIYALEVQAQALTSSDIYDPANPYNDFFGLWVATVHFGILPYSFTDRPYVSVRRSGRAGIIAAPVGTMKFAANNEVIDIPPGIPVFQEDFVVTWHEVTDLDAALATIEPLAGMVNSTAIALRTRTYAPGTIHFPEFDAEDAISFGGSRKAQLSFPVRWRPRPTWLQGIRKDGTPDTITPQVLLTGNLNPLFG